MQYFHKQQKKKKQKTLAMVFIYFKINRVQDKVETFDAEKAIKQY